MQFQNAVVGQSGGPTAAINATLAGVIKGCLESQSIKTLYGMKNGIMGFLKEELIQLNSYFENDQGSIDLLAATPAAALGSCRKKLSGDEELSRIYDILQKYEIGYFFYIGGNDSMDTVAKLADFAQRNPGRPKVCFIGVPKTIDNDLQITDHTPGFGSAAKFVAASMQEIMRDCSVYVTKAVTIVEIMGRDAGWLTASAALTKHISGTGPDFIYVPEAAFDEAQFIEALKEKLFGQDQNTVVVAVSEGIRTSSGTYVAQKAVQACADGFGHSALSGVGKYLEELVKYKIGCKCRSVELNILQRCASHIASGTDIEESILIGQEAVKHAQSGESGRMMAFRRDEKSSEYKINVFAEDVRQAANKVKHIPQEFLSGDGKGVNQKCIDYLLPLIKGEIQTVYVNGLPKHFEF